ncbi:hypothetical protein C4D28_04755 [Clostridium perfringens]
MLANILKYILIRKVFIGLLMKIREYIKKKYELMKIAYYNREEDKSNIIFKLNSFSDIVYN